MEMPTWPARMSSSCSTVWAAEIAHAGGDSSILSATTRDLHELLSGRSNLYNSEEAVCLFSEHEPVPSSREATVVVVDAEVIKKADAMEKPGFVEITIMEDSLRRCHHGLEAEAGCCSTPRRSMMPWNKCMLG
ncbi:hypothetical protein ACP70R_047129 [Stipagrostis hirtigluma subsp. patula]